MTRFGSVSLAGCIRLARSCLQTQAVPLLLHWPQPFVRSGIDEKPYSSLWEKARDPGRHQWDSRPSRVGALAMYEVPMWFRLKHFSGEMCWCITWE